MQGHSNSAPELNQEKDANNPRAHSIQRADHSRNFFVMNRNAAQDKDLSLQATGLLAYLLSLPGDWKIYKTQLYKNKSNGREATITAFNELMDKKYILGIQQHSGNLRTGFKYYVFEEKYDESSSEFKKFLRNTGNTFPETKDSDKTSLLNTHILNTHKQNTNKGEPPDKYKIKLTKDEKNKLIEKMGKEKVEDYITQIELYLKSIGQPKKYKCLYSTILMWERRDSKKEGGIKKISKWSDKEDENLAIAFKVYEHYMEKVCNDPCLFNKGHLEMKEKALFDPKSQMHYKKTYEKFMELLKDRYNMPSHLLNEIEKQCALTAQISTISKNMTYGMDEKR